MSATADSFQGRVLGGRYQVGALLGAGASAVVHEAVDLQLERTVAVKILTAPGTNEPAFQRRFRELASELAGLSHPNIVAVYDWGHEDVGLGDHTYLVMELVTGGSLRAIVDRGRTLSPSQALLVGLDVCRGLDHAHRKGLVHGDVKPGNLLFGADRRVRIADFGLARLIARANRQRSGDLELGSARYLSPEQAQDLVIDNKSDVYSLTLTLVEAVTGQVPFGGDTTVATLRARIDRLLPVSAELGPLASVFEKAGRPNPGERSSAAEFGRALVQVAEKLPKPAPLPLVAGGPALFEAPPGKETTSELTRFRDSTGATRRDPTNPEGARRPGSSDPSGGTQRPRVVTVDEQGDETHEVVRRPRGPVLAYLALVVGLVAASALAFVAYTKLTEKSFDVPSLIGLDEGEARNQIASNDWNVVVRSETTETQPQGKVFRTDPPAGASLREGDQFVLFVSAGPPLATLPDVTNLTVDEATAALQSAGLTLQQGESRYDETVEAGRIIAWTVPAQPTLAAGDQVVRDTAVAVAVSMGPAPREVPDLRGQTLEEAKATIGQYALGIEPDGNDQFSNDYAAGQVMAQSIEPGTTLERGTSFTVTISKGPDLVSVPDVIGQTLETADPAIRAAGLDIGTIAGPNALAGRVIGISYQGSQISAGTQLARGTKVDLVFS